MGAGNSGDYQVIGLGGIDGQGPPFEVAVSRPLPISSSPGFVPVQLDSAEFGSFALTFTSTSTLLDTKIEVLDSSPAGALLWNSLPVSDVGETLYFTIPGKPTRVEIDDMVDFKDDRSQAVTFQRTIANTENAFGTQPNLLEFTETVSTTLQTYNWRQDALAPNARVRKLRKDNYDQFKGQLDDWLALPLSDSDRVFNELRNLLNPILANSNPTTAAISAASNLVQDLAAHVTALQAILDIYSAPLVEGVDRIIETYRQQGADRAVDVLISAQFSTFFNLTQNETSYNGDLREAVRQVNINDLPVSKLNRNPGGMLIEAYEEPDFEYDLSDTEGTDDEPDPPGEVYEWGNSAF